MNAISIRTSVIADLKRLAQLDQINLDAFSESHLEDEVNAGHVLLAEADGQLAGFLAYKLVIDEIEIMRLAVAGKLRRQGIAEALLKCLLAEKGVSQVHLEVRADNLAAIALYEKVGFKHNRIRKKYYSDGCDALVMNKECPS